MSFKKILMLGSAVAVMTSGAILHQAEAATDTLNIDAVIVVPLAVNCTQNLDFGNIDAALGGDVIVAPDGTRSEVGGAELVSGGGEMEGECALTGDTTLAYDVTIPATTVTGPGPAMAVDDFMVSDDGGATSTNATTGTFSDNLVAGAATLSIGATLAVADSATQTAGTYAGTVTVTAVYQ
ncbi:MAG: DUF4402 domain-containing protein [Micavibrio aeruginosavorus]|nr:DUF4402 domain-containing protein [Micavibrio aeruginosavorus]